MLILGSVYMGKDPKILYRLVYPHKDCLKGVLHHPKRIHHLVKMVSTTSLREATTTSPGSSLGANNQPDAAVKESSANPVVVRVGTRRCRGSAHEGVRAAGP